MKQLLGVFLLLLAACGDMPSTAPSSQGSGAVTPVGVDISGTISQGSGKLLAFVYVNLPANVTPAAAEPTSIGGIAPDRSFSFGNLPPGALTILFLVDNGNDGAIDPGDPIALLNDPERRLSSLQAGDQVAIRDVSVDVANGRATVASIEVKHAGAAASPSPQ